MKVTYSTSTTFNGFIADSNGSLDWLFAADAQELPEHDEFVKSLGAQVMGASTYEWLIFGQGIMDQPEMWTHYYGDMPVFVFTHRQLPVPKGANVTFLSGDVQLHRATLEAAAGTKRLWIVGGGDIAGQFAEVGLLDEIILQVAPAALPAGAPLFTRHLGAVQLDLVKVEKFGQFAQLTYNIVRG